MDNIEHLYKCYEILSEAGEKIKEHVQEYKDILKAVKGSSKEKRLASQFIGKFFKHFPELASEALDAQLDLCEDDDVQIRRQAIKDLPKLCQDAVETTPEVGNILAQLLVLDDPLELQQVHNSLQTILKINAKGALAGIFTQIAGGEEVTHEVTHEVTRERCFKFLSTKLFAMGPTIVTKEVEEFLIEGIKKCLQDVTADEFHLCMSILGATKLGSTITGHAELVNLAQQQAELNADIDAITIEDEIVERFIQCATHALPYFSNTIKSTPFVVYICDKLLPLSTWNMIAVSQDQVQLRLLKVFAEMVPFCELQEKQAERIDAVYTILREYMPLPQINENEDVSAPAPSFQFSHAECLLYTLHTLGKKYSDNLNFVNDAEKLKDFRSRLQYLARGTQGYIKKLEEAVKGKSAEELKTEENQLKLTALKTTSNISILIRDLFHSPPSFKHEIQLSWVTRKNTKLGTKRHFPITFDGKKNDEKKSDEKRTKPSTDRKIYSPPSGKYSAKVQNYGGNNSSSSNNSNRGSRARNGNSGSGGGGGGGGSGNGYNRNRRGYKKFNF